MSFILRWKPSVMPLFLVKRHMQAISSLQEARVWARVASGATTIPTAPTTSCSKTVISSGGAYLADIACADRSLPIAYLAALGNQADVSAAELLQVNPKPSDDDIARHMSNLCRCGTYVRIRKAIHRASGLLQEEV